jgi:glycosyltransferase involved in cell wall biosynthesis
VEGHFWPLDNVSDAASLMIRLLEDGPRMKRMSRAAQERYEQCFSYDRIHARLLSFIRGGAELPRLTNVDQPINSCAPQRG